MVKRIGGLGFLDDFHCEKVKFVTFGALVAFLILGYGLITMEFAPEITIQNEPISYFLIAGIILLAGYLGVIYYKVTKNKKLTPKTLILFFLDK